MLNLFAIEKRSLKSKINCWDSEDTVTYYFLCWVSIQPFGFQFCWNCKLSISWMTTNTSNNDFGSNNRNGTNVRKLWSTPVPERLWKSILMLILKSAMTKTTSFSSILRRMVSRSRSGVFKPGKSSRLSTNKWGCVATSIHTACEKLGGIALELAV